MKQGKFLSVWVFYVSFQHSKQFNCLPRHLLLQVRDERVRLLADTEAGLLVQPVNDAEKHTAQQQGIKAQQFMMSLSMQDWHIMKQLVPRTACVMPHRAGHGTPAPPAGGSARAGQRGGNKRARTST
jgi:hypothetical protein